MIYIPLMIFTVVISLACSNTVETNDEPEGITGPLNPAEQNQLLAHSINLGNALEASAEGDWGVMLKESYFEEIRDAGFTAVRIPIRWSAHAQADSPFAIELQFFGRIDWVLDLAVKYKLAAIINIHHYEEIFQEPMAHKKRLLALWEQIGSRYSKQPAEVFFEILNEPHDNLTAELWNEFLLDALDIIRETNPYRTVIIGTAEWGGIQGLEKLYIPESDTNIIATVHYYNPFQFTHQGAEWVDGSDAWLGTKWTGTEEDKNQIVQDFNIILNWMAHHNRPMFIGEFGAYNAADMESRIIYTAFIARYCESKNISWGYWEFCSGFGAFDPETNEWREGLLNALIPVE